ncbi:DUF4097 family beta strand repeat-containing protein [Halobacteriovorax sp. JY17]|uniref:DUF4097 family beta strand repeat-containing protein n=1 Tax=Halobacteriovorax sp. JY17 TaxID=2014617 RepID=UPI000C46E4AD|nr:DUF4097 family beta strand repeat-containing protein [Halobacteriovorax sp. JY17]PIK15199.1 MAG: hypothetical protein CES88_00370 [Halobacteriovorax sp. JY17]
MKRILFLLLLSTVSFGETREFALGHGEFDLVSTSGNIKITGVSGSKLKVNFEKIKWNKDCEIVFKKKDNKVKVEVKEDSSWFSSNECQINFSVSMPKNLESDLKLGSGNIELSEVNGEIDFKLGSGKVSVLNTSSASIEGDVGSGSIEIKYSTLLSGSDFESNTGAGNISILIPKSKTAKVKFKSGTGQLKNTVIQSDTADLKVDVKTGTGSLEIDYVK